MIFFYIYLLLIVFVSIFLKKKGLFLNFSGDDHLSFSYAAFTTVGVGDIVPTGPLRVLAGMEALTGFVLITWTASYLYLEMTRMRKLQS